MGKIENHSVFGRYSQTENKVTAALLQILKVGGTDFTEKFMNQILDDSDMSFPTSEIRVSTQKKENENVYDGLLECDFSFRVLIESKIKNESVNEVQLKGLIENAKSAPNSYIIYITTDNKKPEKLEGIEQLFWLNWAEVMEILKEILKDEKPRPQSEVLSYLIDEFEKFIDYLKLIATPKNRVQIVAGGFGESIAKDYLFYACQNNRGRKESGYLAFYRNKAIKTLFIIDKVENDKDLREIAKNNDKVRQYLDEKEPNYQGDKRQFYKLREVTVKDLESLKIEEVPVINIVHETRGRGKAYTMGAFRYTTIDKFIKAKTTEEL